MADSSEESPVQRQARLRREKRNAKITGGANDRLAKITGVSGRPAPAVENVSSPPSASPSAVDDPEEIDISSHHWTPSPRRLPPSSSSLSSPRASSRPATPPADPMMHMMQQLLGGPPPSGADGADDLPPLLKAMMSGGGDRQPAPAAAATSTANVWRVVHAVFALSLGAYVALATPFTGTKLARHARVDDDAAGINVFYVFATAETALQSGRYFLEKGRLSGGGWIATVANSGVVPEPWNGYLRVAGRYVTIWTTVVGDATAVIFVLGVAAWWRGLAAA